VTCPAVTVREATRADRRAVRDVLGAAFQVEPVYVWLFPDPVRRRRRLGPLLGTVVEHLHRDLGVVQVADVAGTVGGVAVWDAPGRVESGRLGLVRALPGMLRATGRRWPDLARLGGALQAARPPVPHWYLSYLGVDPDRQGHGLGSALLRAMPPARDGVPAYLECKPAHVGYYERFGFAVSGEVVVDPTLSVVTMWREPQRA
jgi:ribosomal protein S18 acetylase RimI-like enzyme